MAADTLAKCPPASWLDVGAGAGGFLHALRQQIDLRHSLLAVEPQTAVRHALRREGWDAVSQLEQLDDDAVDFIGAWHVLEHVTDPPGIFTIVSPRGSTRRQNLHRSHARDALLRHYQSAAFRDFTLWSEHLLLHTRASLRTFAEAAGLSVIDLHGIQRYPLANHLHWLSQANPAAKITGRC